MGTEYFSIEILHVCSVKKLYVCKVWCFGVQLLSLVRRDQSSTQPSTEWLFFFSWAQTLLPDAHELWDSTPTGVTSNCFLAPEDLWVSFLPFVFGQCTHMHRNTRGPFADLQILPWCSSLLFGILPCAPHLWLLWTPNSISLYLGDLEVHLHLPSLYHYWKHSRQWTGETLKMSCFASPASEITAFCYIVLKTIMSHACPAF
jgi:hypothetical protein